MLADAKAGEHGYARTMGAFGDAPQLDFEEALEIATKRMSVMGYFPWEIKEAAQGMLLRRKN